MEGRYNSTYGFVVSNNLEKESLDSSKEFTNFLIFLIFNNNFLKKTKRLEFDDITYIVIIKQYPTITTIIDSYI